MSEQRVWDIRFALTFIVFIRKNSFCSKTNYYSFSSLSFLLCLFLSAVINLVVSQMRNSFILYFAVLITSIVFRNVADPDPYVLSLLDPDPLVRGTDPDQDPSII